MKPGDTIKCHDPADLRHMLDTLNDGGFKAFVCDKNKYIINIYEVPNGREENDKQTV